MFSVPAVSFITCKSFLEEEVSNEVVRLFGYPFFEGQNASEILRMNRKFTFEFDAIYVIKQEMKNPASKISKDALNLLLLLLELDPMKRISAEEALSHPYFIPVPSGMLKMEGSNDLISNPLSKSAT